MHVDTSAKILLYAAGPLDSLLKPRTDTCSQEARKYDSLISRGLLGKKMRASSLRVANKMRSISRSFIQSSGPNVNTLINYSEHSVELTSVGQFLDFHAVRKHRRR